MPYQHRSRTYQIILTDDRLRVSAAHNCNLPFFEKQKIHIWSAKERRRLICQKGNKRKSKTLYPRCGQLHGALPITVEISGANHLTTFGARAIFSSYW